jgi:hypothetical protein
MSASDRTSSYTWDESEAAIKNARSLDALLSILTLNSDIINALTSANSPDGSNYFLTLGDIGSGFDADNLPTSDQKAALPGTAGTPSAINKYVTDSDQRLINGVTTSIFLDCNRTDTYTAIGSPDRPFKTVAASLAYLIAEDTSGVAYYATGTYTTEGGSVTLPDVSLVLHGNQSVITGATTFNIPGSLIARDLDIVGNVNFEDGSGSHIVLLQNQQIDGNVSVETGVTLFLGAGVHFTGNLTTAAGSIIYKSFDTEIDGNITGTGTIYEQVPSAGGGLSTYKVVVTDGAGALSTATVTSTEIENVSGTSTGLGKAEIVSIDSSSITNFTLSFATHHDKIIEIDTASASVTVTLPNSTTDVDIGSSKFRCKIVNIGAGTAAGTVTLVTESGVTLGGKGNELVDQWDMCDLYVVSDDVYHVLSNDLV